MKFWGSGATSTTYDDTQTVITIILFFSASDSRLRAFAQEDNTYIA